MNGAARRVCLKWTLGLSMNTAAFPTPRPIGASPSSPLIRAPGARREISNYHPLLLQQEQASPREKAKELNQKGVDDHEKELTETFARHKQNRRPWHRAGSEAGPPSDSGDPSKGDHTKGRLLTTPTRLLKLILPLPFHVDKTERTRYDSEKSDEANRKEELEDIQPLALLVHPQQPLSYLERLLQAEVHPIRDGRNERIPHISFYAEADLGSHHHNREKGSNGNRGSSDAKAAKRSNPWDDGNVSSYSGLGHEGPERREADADWVRWSSSTEIGDFIRDAARGREFVVAIEGYNRELRVAVPSFNDRTYYMRIRLRKMSRRIHRLAEVKEDCDQLAQKGAHRIAQGGFGALLGWWGIVYYVTFHTDMGWDLVEPVTYLVGLTTIMGGYMWFLYMSRDLSYKAALNVTVSRRQHALYQSRGFDPDQWEGLVQEANSLRREIKMVASEYDVDWDEDRDLGSAHVKEVLEDERQDQQNGNGKKNGRQKEEEEEVAEEQSEEELVEKEQVPPGRAREQRQANKE